MNSVAFYQPDDSAAGDRERLTLQLVPDLSDAVDLIVLFPDTLGFNAQIHFRLARSDAKSGFREIATCA